MNLKDPNRDQQQHSVTCKHAGGGIGELQFTLCPRKKKTPGDAESKKKEVQVRSSFVLCFSLTVFYLSLKVH